MARSRGRCLRWARHTRCTGQRVTGARSVSLGRRHGRGGRSARLSDRGRQRVKRESGRGLLRWRTESKRTQERAHTSTRGRAVWMWRGVRGDGSVNGPDVSPAAVCGGSCGGMWRLTGRSRLPACAPVVRLVVCCCCVCIEVVVRLVVWCVESRESQFMRCPCRVRSAENAELETPDVRRPCTRESGMHVDVQKWKKNEAGYVRRC